MSIVSNPSTAVTRAAGTRRRPIRATPALLIVLCLLLVMPGCARVQAALAVQPDDTVAGEIVIATPAQGPEDTGPAVTPPPELDGEVEVVAYDQDGYVGSVLRFGDLSFSEVGLLIGSAGPAGEAVSLDMRRAGSRVLVTGDIDLTSVPVDRADFQFKISFPGQVVETGGDLDGSGTVSWVFDAGQVSDVTAVAAFADPDAPSPTNWALLVAVLVAAASAVVALLARWNRNPPLDAPIR